MASSAFDDLTMRLAALEARSIKVRDLPMRALQDKLEQDWHPDGSLLFNNQGLPRGGTTTLTYSGGVLSATTTVAHGLGRTPVCIVATAFSSPAVDQVPLCNTFTWTEDSFQINGEIDAAYTGDITVAWLAI